MKTIELSYPHQLKHDHIQETVAAIGFFDGIHRGHQKVIMTAKETAKQTGRLCAVISFHPHPSVVLREDVSHVNYLTPIKEKEEILEAMGVDLFYIIRFNEQLSKLAPQSFIDHFIIGLHIKHLVAGFDFTYGHKGLGTMDQLANHPKLATTIVEKVEVEGEKISSTLIRELLVEGHIEKASQLLGRPLQVRGIVEQGEQIGRELGYKTANLKLASDYFLPKLGVYAVTIYLDGRVLCGMANLGYTPTVQIDNIEPKLEVHILDYNKPIYGQELVIEWNRFIRSEAKFNSMEDLTNQIKLDESKVRSYFAKNRSV
ncbi:riboflavin biosynthesis protein RibF [Aquibacillus salsiterrae]|uniref:Riboflavin biosynthesis protein n=1 Tax=Aquibacillus salsiterrae TaxID=2950439 RepID=A0A9X3WG06_9BACI|nr:riboflavin biosynthesis protein RibF [Aquibacillus salsiterrae]MDC3416356.1 riboflavin biosynthesis protein RibF [Aquibacillus salsiterrae]